MNSFGEHRKSSEASFQGMCKASSEQMNENKFLRFVNA